VRLCVRAKLTGPTEGIPEKGEIARGEDEKRMGLPTDEEPRK
jgi:hypothetical protein